MPITLTWPEIAIRLLCAIAVSALIRLNPEDDVMDGDLEKGPTRNFGLLADSLAVLGTIQTCAAGGFSIAGDQTNAGHGTDGLGR